MRLLSGKTRWRTGLAQSLRFQTKPKKISCLSTNTCQSHASKYCTWLQPKSLKPQVIGEFSRSVSPRPFILTVGKRFRYKNFLTLLKAYAGNSRINRDFDLVIVDNEPWQTEEIKIINRAGLQRKIHLKRTVSDQSWYCITSKPEHLSFHPGMKDLVSLYWNLLHAGHPCSPTPRPACVKLGKMRYYISLDPMKSRHYPPSWRRFATTMQSTWNFPERNRSGGKIFMGQIRPTIQ